VCGRLRERAFVDQPIISAAVNVKQGLPSPAGTNTAIQQGTTKIGGAVAVAGSVQ
jgi:hypothetical protein